jgi:ATP-dependent Clp protease ATP-binding subunit ClpA
MFERFTERARRVIFFARYEASNFGSLTIESEHLLLGLLREDNKLPRRFASVSSDELRNDAIARMNVREKLSVAIDLPLSEECKRVLSNAVLEADQLDHKYVGAEHLLLGMLRDENCVAAQVLAARGVNGGSVRESMGPSFPRQQPHLPEAGIVPDADTAKRVAETIWTPLYTAEEIAAQAPLQAELKERVWLVTGSAAPEEALFAYIVQADGRILSVGRGRTE